MERQAEFLKIIPATGPTNPTFIKKDIDFKGHAEFLPHSPKVTWACQENRPHVAQNGGGCDMDQSASLHVDFQFI